MGTPPTNPGTMTPEEKSALGTRLGLQTPPPVLSGSGTVAGDLSDVNVGEVQAQMADAYNDIDGFEAEARDVILASPMGSTATEGYHLAQQSDVVDDQGYMNVGPVPEGPKPEGRA